MERSCTVFLWYSYIDMFVLLFGIDEIDIQRTVHREIFLQ